MRGIILISLVFSNLAFSETNSCVPKHQFFPFSGSWVSKNERGDIALGMYARVSPDGKYVLRSFSGEKLSQVTLMELVPGKMNAVRPYETPLKNEAFPVQGSWRYLVDVSGEHYKLNDIIKYQKKAKKQFKGGIGGFYTVAAELPNGSAKLHQIRSLSWPNSDSDNMGQGVLTNKVITARLNSNATAELVSSTGINYMCSNIRSTDGSVMSLPMISPDGSEFSAMPQNPKDSDPSMRIYSFGKNNKDCTPVLDLKVMVAKIVFSSNEQKQILFYSSGSLTNKGNGIHFYDRNVNKMFTLDDAGKKIAADSYPGFTKDGRIVYGANWEECNDKDCRELGGYIVSDPYQSADIIDYKKDHPELAGKFKDCITNEDVVKVIEEQKLIWNYSL
ncbi:MAG: hypothetical protein Q7U04_18095 [Bacteriovorax sp.]|nr:hypothetical protein [Bacteriovorax sp.]